MRDYDLEEFLIHYGTKGMNRPRGLKYRTKNNRGSISVYQHRRDQMYNNASTEEEKSTSEWNKEKYIKDTKNNVEKSNSADRKQSKGYNKWEKLVKGNEGYDNKAEKTKEKPQTIQDKMFGIKKSKSRYGSKCLAHYGIPNMKRPHGLKYKTKNNGSISLYQRRQEQMNKDNPTTDEDLRKKAKVRLLTYGQRNTGVNSPEKHAKREEDRKKFQEELNARVAERKRNEQERLEAAKKKMQQSKNKLLGKSDDWKPDYSNGFMAKRKQEMAKKLASSVKKNSTPSEWSKTVNKINTKNKAQATMNEMKKVAKKKNAEYRMQKYGMIPGSPEYELKRIETKTKNIMNGNKNKSNVTGKYGNDNVISEIKKKNTMQKSKKIKKNGYKG